MKNNLPKLDNIENENKNKIYENKENDNNDEINVNNNNDEENNIITIEKEEGDSEIKKKISEEEININSKKKFNKLGIKRYDSLNTKQKEEKVVVTPNINNINNENKNINISKNKNSDINSSKKNSSKFNNIHKKISLFKRKRSNSQFFTSKFEDMFEIITQATNDNIFDNINLYGGDIEEIKGDESNNIEIIGLNSITYNNNNRNSFHKKNHKDSIDINNKNSNITHEIYGNIKRSNSNENLIDKKLKNNYFDDLDFEENIIIENKKVKKKVGFGPIQSKKTFNENNKKKYKKTFSLFHKK
jgi:hypothetical protein